MSGACIAHVSTTTELRRGSLSSYTQLGAYQALDWESIELQQLAEKMGQVGLQSMGHETACISSYSYGLLASLSGPSTPAATGSRQAMGPQGVSCSWRSLSGEDAPLRLGY